MKLFLNRKLAKYVSESELVPSWFHVCVLCLLPRPHWLSKCPTSLLLGHFLPSCLLLIWRLRLTSTQGWKWTQSLVTKTLNCSFKSLWKLVPVSVICTCPFSPAVISLDTLGEEDTESILMVEPPEDQGPDDGRSMVIVGPQGPPGKESPTTQMPKRSPPSYNAQSGLKKRRRGGGGQQKALPNKPQDLQVLRLDHR